MKNQMIMTYNNKPIYMSELFDGWVAFRTVRALFVRDHAIHALEPYTDTAYFDEYMRKQTVDGRTLTQWFNIMGAQVWAWNEVANDWEERK